MSQVRERGTYSIQTHLEAVPYDEAVEKVTGALKEEGFGVLSTIDVKSTLKEKLDADFRPYIILGACNPPLAKRALDAELELGLLLPCNVIVYADESGAGSVVSAVEPRAMLGVAQNPELVPIAENVQGRLTRALESL